MPLDLNKIKLNTKKVAFCRFKKLDDKYLLTNDVGFYKFLKPAQFKDFIKGKLKEESETYQELKEKGFIKDDYDIDKMIDTYRCYNSFLFQGTSLHIVVVTLRCNFKCIYCQASRRPMEEKQYDMSKETARNVVNMMFESPSDIITIEFQGGEPLVNWPVVKFIVEYARKKNKKVKKKLLISLVTNLSLMTEEKYRFFIEKKVSLCTSLDGPEELHNKNRPWTKGNSYQIVTSWIDKIKKEEKEEEKSGRGRYHLSALTTISKFSLQYPKEIVEEYYKWGFRGIHLRPLSFLGFSGGTAKEKIGYSAREFMEFWRKSMDYIIEINVRGRFFYERGAAIMLKKILTDENPGFLDLRSPCGAAIGQLVYNYDGRVYTCDEGRMVKDDTFMLGDVNKDAYEEIVSNPKVKTMITASTLDNLSCDYCVYKPYCGVCPVLSYALYGNLFPQFRNTDQCKIHEEMFEYLFRKIENEEVKKIFLQWVKRSRG
ncbi:MAG: His-Xaa-Ser system radical SAM maturase HxsB [Candidatus Nealsonbacteria bacterium]|nr:MAG: His-Xaa-Ser system radical SAM maturase HxsB [Candidatus Nealsonbacteria bacterium]